MGTPRRSRDVSHMRSSRKKRSRRRTPRRSRSRRHFGSSRRGRSCAPEWRSPSPGWQMFAPRPSKLQWYELEVYRQEKGNRGLSSRSPRSFYEVSPERSSSLKRANGIFRSPKRDLSRWPSPRDPSLSFSPARPPHAPLVIPGVENKTILPGIPLSPSPNRKPPPPRTRGDSPPPWPEVIDYSAASPHKRLAPQSPNSASTLSPRPHDGVARSRIFSPRENREREERLEHRLTNDNRKQKGKGKGKKLKGNEETRCEKKRRIGREIWQEKRKEEEEGL